MRNLPLLTPVKALGLFLAASLIYAGCQPAPPSAASPSPPVLPSPTLTVEVETIAPPTAAAPLPTAGSSTTASSSATEHRIAIRTVDGKEEFFDRVTGERFVPRGYNYIQVAPMSATNPGMWHSTLNPGYYDPDLVEQSLQAMHASGYNTVRIFIDCCREGNNAGDPKGGVSQRYLSNVIDFLNRAKAADIYVLMVMDLTPAEKAYGQMWGYCCSQFDGENLRYLTPGGHYAERSFNRDFIRALQNKNAPIDVIFAYDLNNEVHFSPDKPPLSLKSGSVKTANGVIYDMGKPGEKQRMVEENLVYWIDRQRDNILDIDPTALVTASFPAINLGYGYLYPPPGIYQSSADFIDLHTYLGWGLSLEEYMRRYSIQDVPPKLIIMGELGADRRAFSSADEAAAALTEWQAESCKYGFVGWLVWTYNVKQPDNLWHGVSDQGQIDQALSPADRPDPCE